MADALIAERRFSSEGKSPYDAAGEWHKRDVCLTAAGGDVVFEQSGVEIPVSWSETAGNIVAQKYFRGKPGSDERESSVAHLIRRVVSTIVGWGWADGYFEDEDERDLFAEEMVAILVSQRAAFNSPVWFNLGVEDAPDQVSACFILSVEDSLESILDWVSVEGNIFRGGSGAGANLSAIRGSMEHIAGGGLASGPVSFMAGADASAGAIKSGGKTRRAAKMVLLDADHPDVEEFIWCKAVEERKSRVLEEAGMVNGIDDVSVRFQNANNSVRVSDELMRLVEDGGEWPLISRLGGETVKTVDARSLWRQIAEAAWECADPGVQFSTTINDWHTCPNTGPINASNPCSEYVHLDDSACNLSSLNLMKFLDDEGEFDAEGFAAAVRVMTVAMDILVDRADYPTGRIGDTTRRFRQLGIGYSNLGAVLMARGTGYDSDGGRNFAAAVTSLLTAAAYDASADIAERLGAFGGFDENRDPMTAIIRKHLKSHEDGLGAYGGRTAELAGKLWASTADRVADTGVRNSQATVLAPTGTISFMMDCDTTGIEPDLALVKNKQLVGGGDMRLVNRSVNRALRRLGYPKDAADAIVAHVERTGDITGAEGLEAAHVDVFATSLGDNAISPTGHVRMMAAVQPFLSGAISKTVNLPAEATVDDVSDVFTLGWKLGLKAVAVYRDGCKIAQPLQSAASVQVAYERRPLPAERVSKTVEWEIKDCKGYMTVGEYEDGTPGEVFVRVSKHGGTLAGLMDSWAVAISHGLQMGVSIRSYLEAYRGFSFPPNGVTTDVDVRIATSLPDFLVRKLAVMYLPVEERADIGLLSAAERASELPGMGDSGQTPYISDAHAPLCLLCGNLMQRAGSCFACPGCGTTSGCS